jgi:hypothetical protein
LLYGSHVGANGWNSSTPRKPARLGHNTRSISADISTQALSTGYGIRAKEHADYLRLRNISIDIITQQILRLL